MEKEEFCKKVDAFIEDEANAEKEYADFKQEIESMKISLTMNEEHQMRHLSMDEAGHKRFWKEIKEKVCKI